MTTQKVADLEKEFLSGISVESIQYKAEVNTNNPRRIYVLKTANGFYAHVFTHNKFTFYRFSTMPEIRKWIALCMLANTIVVPDATKVREQNDSE